MKKVNINLQHKDQSALKAIQDVLNSAYGEPQTVFLSIKNANRVKSKQLTPGDDMLSMPRYFFEKLDIVEVPCLDDQTLILGYEVDYIYDEFYYGNHDDFMTDLDEAIHDNAAYENKVESVVFSHSAWNKFVVNPDIQRMAVRATASESTIFGVRHRRADNMRENMVKVIYTTPHPQQNTITEIYQ